MYLTMQVMAKHDPTQEGIIQRMMQMTLAVDKGKGMAYLGNEAGQKDEDGRAIVKEDEKEDDLMADL